MMEGKMGEVVGVSPLFQVTYDDLARVVNLLTPVHLEMALYMAYAKPSDIHKLKNELRSCTILAAEPFNGANEAVVELRRPAEAGVLGADVGTHRRRGVAGLGRVLASFLLHRAIIVACS